MTKISGATTASNQQVRPKSGDTESRDTRAEFSQFFAKVMGRDRHRQISEEEIFSLAVKGQIRQLKGSGAAKVYQNFLDRFGVRGDLNYQFERGATRSLTALVNKGILSQEEADQIYSQSFAASQMDDNSEELWDDSGDTSATIKVGRAIRRVSRALAEIVHGERSAPERSLMDSGAAMLVDEAPQTEPMKSDTTTQAATTVPQDSQTIMVTGRSIDGAGGILFKPVSSNESKLAVLMHPAWRNMVSQVALLDETGKQIEVGRSTGYGETGEREKFRFRKQGAEYPANMTVKISFNDGTSRTMLIPDPSKRYD